MYDIAVFRSAGLNIFSDAEIPKQMEKEQKKKLKNFLLHFIFPVLSQRSHSTEEACYVVWYA